MQRERTGHERINPKVTLQRCKALSYIPSMPNKNASITFRADDVELEIISELKSWFGLKASQIVRLALLRLHREESKRRTNARPTECY